MPTIMIVSGHDLARQTLMQRLKAREHKIIDIHFDEMFRPILLDETDLLVTDGTCKTLNERSELCFTWYNQPREFAEAKGVAVVPFRSFRRKDRVPPLARTMRRIEHTLARVPSQM